MYVVVSYKGGKRQELEHIQRYEPKKIGLMVDTFGGGATVSMFYNLRGYRVVYNDKGRGIYNLLKMVRDKPKLLKRQMKRFKYTLTEFRRIINRLDSNVPSHYFYKSITAYRGTTMNSRSPNMRNGKFEPSLGKIDKIDTVYTQQLQGIRMENRDYRDIIKKYEKVKGVFFYMDPPYLSCSSNRYEGVVMKVLTLQVTIWSG